MVPTPTAAPTFVYGDANGDGGTNSVDFALFRLYLLGVNSEMPSKDWKTSCDLNGDKSINSIDFAVLKSYLLGIIHELPFKAST